MSDPLKDRPDAELALFSAFSASANGHTAEQVVGAAINLLVNAVRQAHGGRMSALSAFDELTARARSLLADHYDMAGKRRNVFPFHQRIEIPHLDFRPRRNGRG